LYVLDHGPFPKEEVEAMMLVLKQKDWPEDEVVDALLRGLGRGIDVR
jgi:hypothetical protein